MFVLSWNTDDTDQTDNRRLMILKKISYLRKSVISV